MHVYTSAHVEMQLLKLVEMQVENRERKISFELIKELIRLGQSNQGA